MACFQDQSEMKKHLFPKELK